MKEQLNNTFPTKTLNKYKYSIFIFLIDESRKLMQRKHRNKEQKI
jgi:hypothetical protein